MNHFKISIFVWALVFSFSACIKEYTPELDSSDTNNYVIAGELTNLEGFHYIYISISSGVEKFEYIPVNGCLVTIYDINNNAFEYSENGNGVYVRYMPNGLINSGTEYFLEVKTPDGKTYLSETVKMSVSGQIDTINYEIQSQLIFNSDPYVYRDGVQFFIDGSNSSDSAFYYKWNVSETWEYKVDQPIRWYYVGYVVHVFPADFSRMVCWRSIELGDIFLGSSEFLSENKYKKARLHFVDNNSQRLKYLYSIEITQLSMDKNAYNYWQLLQTNNSQSGGLYTMQPADIKGNIYNSDNTNEIVLGYFTVAGATKKRIFVDKQRDIPELLMDDARCDTIKLERGGFREIDRRMYPAYLVGDDFKYSMAILTTPCVDCLQMGGDTVQPAFWPIKKK
jgi:hypothetical protein